MSEAEVADSESRTIDRDLSCMICGYNLRGLQTAGACPECGTDIARSTQGDLLEFADRNWVGSVYRGTCLLTIADGLLVICILAAIVIPFVLMAVSNPTASNVVGTTFSIMLSVSSLTAIVLMVLGVWLVTKQEPRVSVTEQAASNRRIARAAVCFVFVLYGLTMVVLGSWRVYLWMFLAISFLIALYSCLSHVELIARRAPDDEVVAQARKRRKRIITSGIAAVLFNAARIAAPFTAAPPEMLTNLLILGSTVSALYLFFGTISAIGALGRFRPVLSKVLDDARAA